MRKEACRVILVVVKLAVFDLRDAAVDETVEVVGLLVDYLEISGYLLGPHTLAVNHRDPSAALHCPTGTVARPRMQVDLWVLSLDQSEES